MQTPPAHQGQKPFQPNRGIWVMELHEIRAQLRLAQGNAEGALNRQRVRASLETIAEWVHWANEVTRLTALAMCLKIGNGTGN